MELQLTTDKLNIIKCKKSFKISDKDNDITEGDTIIRLAGLIQNSLVNGLGLRKVFFAQGCKHNCIGCFNKDTHDFKGGTPFSVNNLINIVKKDILIKGVTFSGGDPFEQAKEFYIFAKKIKEVRPDIDIWTYTGYTLQELKDENDPYKIKLLMISDFITDGKFVEELHDSTLKYRGSRNQKIYYNQCGEFKDISNQIDKGEF